MWEWRLWWKAVIHILFYQDKAIFHNNSHFHQDLLLCFVSEKIDLHCALVLNKTSMVHPSTCKCPPAESGPAVATGWVYWAGAVVLLCWLLEWLYRDTPWCCSPKICKTGVLWDGLQFSQLSDWSCGHRAGLALYIPEAKLSRTGIFYLMAFTHHRVYIADLPFTFAVLAQVPLGITLDK